MSITLNTNGPSITLTADDSRGSFEDLNSMAMTPPFLLKTNSIQRTVLQFSALTIDESDTLDQTAGLLRMLVQANSEQIPEVIQRVKNLVESEELLPKLKILRAKLAPEEQFSTYEAELLLMHFVYGTVKLQDVQKMRNTINELNLPSHIDKIATYALQATSL